MMQSLVSALFQDLRGSPAAVKTDSNYVCSTYLKASNRKKNGNPKAPRKRLPWRQYESIGSSSTSCLAVQRGSPAVRLVAIPPRKKNTWNPSEDMELKFPFFLTIWEIPIQLGKNRYSTESAKRFASLRTAGLSTLSRAYRSRIKWYEKITESSRCFQHMLPLKSHNPSQSHCFHDSWWFMMM